MQEKNQFSNFAPLKIFTPFSLARGTIKIPDLIKFLVKERIKSAAICDIGMLGASLDFATACVNAGIKPIIGVTVFLEWKENDPRKNTEFNKNNLSKMTHVTSGPNNRKNFDQICLYAKNQNGFSNLMQLASVYWKNRLNAAEHYEHGFITHDDLQKYCADLLVLSGGMHGDINKLIQHGHKDFAAQMIKYYQELFPNDSYCLEISRQGLKGEKQVEPELKIISKTTNTPLVATQSAFFIEKEMFKAHDILLCIAQSSVNINETNREHACENCYLPNTETMYKLFSDIPQAVENSYLISEKCSFWPEANEPKLPSFKCELGEDKTLTQQANAGLQTLLEKTIKPYLLEQTTKNAASNSTDHSKFIEQKILAYHKRLEYELSIIHKMGYSGYFLIVSDYIQFAKNKNIPVGPGRGSGAGSLVAWTLGITNIDPLRFGLIFERFLNPERMSMPDFDIDFCQERREEVIEYVYKKYGHDYVAQIITFGQMQSKMVLRDVGRVLGLSYFEVDHICSLVPYNPASPISLKEALSLEAKLQEAYHKNESTKYLIDIGIQLEGMYRHTSTHAAGLVIGSDRLVKLMPLYFDTKSQIAITQYNMKDVEKIGLVKFDFLGLKTLSVIKQAVDIITQTGTVLDIEKIPLDDKKTFQLMQNKFTVGIFQLENSGIRDVAHQMHVNSLDDIIALISLYRPGPLDNIPIYIERKTGKTKVPILDPSLEPILGITYGIPIYQEQIIKIAQVFSGYSLAKADLLRKAMGKKVPEIMAKEKKGFIEGALKNGHKIELAEEIFSQIEKFAGYGFNKSHAAAYAMISYQTAYLKANYPSEFMSATLNYMIGNTEKIAMVIQELKIMGIAILPPDINKSNALFTPEYDQTTGKTNIRYGLYALKNIGKNTIDHILEIRKKLNTFEDIWSFFWNISPKIGNSKQIEQLIKAGSFDNLNPKRRQLFESLPELKKNMGFYYESNNNKPTRQKSIFNQEQMPPPKNILQEVCHEWSGLKKLDYELSAIGFYISSHPLEHYQLNDNNRQLLANLINIHDPNIKRQTVTIMAVLLSKQVKVSKTTKKRYAFLRISDTSGSKEVTVFSGVFAEYENLLEEGNLLEITLRPNNRVSNDGLQEEATWIVEKINDLTTYLDTLVKNKEIVLQITNSLEINLMTDFKNLKNNLREGSIDLKIKHQVENHDVLISIGKYSYHSIMKTYDELNNLKKVS